jgi:hypothetical protein
MKGKGVILVFTLMLLAAALPATASARKTKMIYGVVAHPDDETAGWSAIQQRSDTYTVLVTMTRGENTRSCVGPEDWGPSPGPPPEPEEPNADFGWVGPHRYQGPDSPVGQPDEGEQHPLGNPWQGKGTRACADARLHSWNSFLDDMALEDRTLPFRPSYRGKFCAPMVGCAKVWADDVGARVAFDRGDGNLTPIEVTQAIQVLRDRRAKWGLPTLPEHGVAALAFYNASNPCVGTYNHPDHGAVQEAIYRDDPGAGDRMGVTCEGDPRFHDGGTAMVWDPHSMVHALNIDPVTQRRLGAYVRHYGWLFDTYPWIGDPQQLFWTRSGVHAPPRPPGGSRPQRRSMRLSVAPKTGRSGKPIHYSFSTRVADANQRRAVRGATIRFAGRRLTSNGSGRAATTVRLRRGNHRAYASKPGLASGKAIVRVR